MGAGASSGAGHPGPAPSAFRGPVAGGPLATAHKLAGSSESGGSPRKHDQARGASVSSLDQSSPKYAKHVIIQAADTKAHAAKGRQGGLVGKVRQSASQDGSSVSSTVTGRLSSLVGSHAARRTRRDEYDVDSDDSSLDGFIYEDESTSEDEREDYVNAFSRKKKPHRVDDYSEFEGAAVRALTANTRKLLGDRRRSRSTASDVDDGYDPEEDRICELRHQKRQQEQERAKLTTGTAAAAVGAVRRSDESAPGPSGAAPGTLCQPQQQKLSQQPPHMQQQLQPQQPQRMFPQPPLERPVRGVSASLRRGGAGGSSTGGAPGAAPGVLEASGGALGLRPAAPPPPPAVYIGATASSQYWQAKRGQDEGPAHDCVEGSGMSRLEQLAAIQRKRQADQQRQQQQGGSSGEVGSDGGEGHMRGGVRWQVLQEAPSPSRHPPQMDAEPSGSGNRAASFSGGQPSWPLQQPQPPSSPRPQQQPQGLHHVRISGAGSFARASNPLTSTSTSSSSSSRPMSRPAVSRLISGADFDVDALLSTFEPDRSSQSTQQPFPQQQQQQQQEQLQLKQAQEAAQQQQQWAMSRPQQPPSERTEGAANATSSSQQQPQRSIRAVQSDFTINASAVSAPELVTARMLSLPTAAARPVNTAAAPTTQSAPSSSGAGAPAAPAPAAQIGVSRFARLGANMMGPSSGPATTADCSAAASGGGCFRAGPSKALAAAAPTPAVTLGTGGSHPVSSARRVRRTTCSSDEGSGGGGTAAAQSYSPTSLGTSSNTVFGDADWGPRAKRASAPGYDVGCGPQQLQRPGSGVGRFAQASDTGCGGGYGGGGMGTSSILKPAGTTASTAAAAVAMVGRTRFGAVQHQQFQLEAERTSAPVPPTRRESDSGGGVMGKAGPPGRASWAGGVGFGGGVGAGPSVLTGAAVRLDLGPSGGGGLGTFGAGAAVGGGLLGNARNRVGQVGA